MKFETLNKNALKCMYTATGLGVLVSMAGFTFIMLYFSLFSNALAVGIYTFLMILLAINGIISRRCAANGTATPLTMNALISGKAGYG